METKPTLDIHLPPGFRFHPSDEELIVHYLKNKVASRTLPATIIAELDLYKYSPWDLPKKALFGDDEWYFFTPRDRKYPNGARPNRAAASGYWKATGTDKPILTSRGTISIGVKKALVFYKGRPPKGIKTDWIMHEYRLLQTTMEYNPKRRDSMRLDDWVLCRVRQKSSLPRSTWENRNNPEGYLSKVNDTKIETIKNYLYSDCPMLPYIIASQTLSCIEKASSICLQRSDYYTDTNDIDHFEVNSLQVDTDQQEKFATTVSKNGTDMNFYGSINNQSNISNFSCDPWNSDMQCQD